MKLEVYNLDRKKVRDIELADEVFAAQVNEALFYEVVKAQLASRRQGTAAAKERSAVAGSSKKVYKQKGTGQARHGSIRAPVFAGGGKAHGPLPRSYAYDPPKKVRRGAVRSALSLYAKEGRLLVVEGLDLEEIKTGALAAILEKLEVPNGLLVDSGANEKLRLSARNLPRHMFLPPEGVNLYDVLRHQQLVLTEGAARALEARYRDRADGHGSTVAAAVRAKPARAKRAGPPKATKAPKEDN